MDPENVPLVNENTLISRLRTMRKNNIFVSSMVIFVILSILGIYFAVIYSITPSEEKFVFLVIVTAHIFFIITTVIQQLIAIIIIHYIITNQEQFGLKKHLIWIGYLGFIIAYISFNRFFYVLWNYFTVIYYQTAPIIYYAGTHLTFYIISKCKNLLSSRQTCFGLILYINMIICYLGINIPLGIIYPIYLFCSPTQAYLDLVSMFIGVGTIMMLPLVLYIFLQ